MQDLIQFYETIYSIHENISPYGANLSFSFLDVEKKNSDQMCSSYFLPISTLQIAMHLLPWDHPYITSAKGLGGWVIQMSIFADVQYCIYADLVCGWVRKSLKFYWHNIWTVFYIKLVSCQCLESQVTVCLNTQWVQINSQGVFLFVSTLLFCDNAHSEMISPHCLSPYLHLRLP